MPLCRLRYNGSASTWGFAIYLASRNGYDDNILPSGLHAGSSEEALDCACGLYLNHLTPGYNPRRINDQDHLETAAGGPLPTMPARQITTRDTPADTTVHPSMQPGWGDAGLPALVPDAGVPSVSNMPGRRAAGGR